MTTKTPLLKRFQEAEQELLINHSTLFPVKKGAYVFMEGDEADRIFFIKEGTIRIHKQLDAGKEVTIFVRKEEDGFGEIGPFSGDTYSCSARAETDGQIYAITRKQIESILHNNAPIATGFLKWVAESLETSSSKLKDYMVYQTGGAVASVLIRLANTTGRKTENGIVIEPMMTHYEIATHIGSTRETVNRFLTNWRNDGIIEVNSKKLVIKDIDFLRGLLGCDRCGVQNCVI